MKQIKTLLIAAYSFLLRKQLMHKQKQLTLM
jgi:hypothetical protein